MPDHESYKWAAKDRRSNVEMDIGSRNRVLYDTDETTVTVSFLLYEEEVEYFTYFTRTVLDHWKKWFHINLQTGSKVLRHFAQFVDVEDAKPAGVNTWMISAVLRVEKRRNAVPDCLMAFAFYCDKDALCSAALGMDAALTGLEIPADIWGDYALQ